MSASGPCIRDAAADDAAAIAAIYAHHVRHGTASFDEVPPDAAFWRAKIADVTARGWPFLVAEEEGQVAGYAYATQFRDRPAYAHTCENSIYVHPQRIGRGIGKELLTRLVDRATAAGFRQMVAVVGGPEPASVALHRACGFAEAGRMRQVGYKFGHWLDTLYMQRTLRE
jgi:L-amino acid N-acyltransferase YncA